MKQYNRTILTTAFILSLLCLPLCAPGLASPPIKVEDIAAKVWEKARTQQTKVNDYVCTLLSNKQEKDNTGKVESVTRIEMKSYFKKPDKQLKEFVKATKDGKTASKKDLQPGVFAASFVKSSEELAEEIQKEMKSIITFSSDYKDKLDMKILREEKIEGGNTWVIETVSRSKDLKLKKATLWISQDKLRTIKIEAESVKNPSTFVKIIKVTTSLSEVAPEIFLPKATKIETSLSKVSSKQVETMNEYSNYKINSGLADSLFLKP
ncbi:MAG: outer membrane lipoprotein-sorting protein [Proteobacteria bacterium]|nr:outer membrane lipoprotein-sorting protein [Pseudomonadota bacterium]